MSILSIALKAKIPMIRVTTDDMVNIEVVLQSIAGTSAVFQIESLSVAALHKPDTLLWTNSDKTCNVDNYELLEKKEKTLVFVNATVTSLMFDAGELLPSDALVQGVLDNYGGLPGVRPMLSGLSLKSIDHVLRLTSVAFGNLLPSSIKSMRAMLSKPVSGLVPVETVQPLYYPHKPLADWAETCKPYFLSANVNPALRPRGILLHGSPGTGKTASSKYLANLMGVPLYRLDLSGLLNKFVGNSEANLARLLTQVSEFAPCVPPGTQIRTTIGTLSVEEIAARCKTEHFFFNSVDPETLEPCVLKLHQMITRAGAPCLRITTDTSVIECTENHRLLVKRGSSTEWVEAKDLQIDDDLLEV